MLRKQYTIHWKRLYNNLNRTQKWTTTKLVSPGRSLLGQCVQNRSVSSFSNKLLSLKLLTKSSWTTNEQINSNACISFSAVERSNKITHWQTTVIGRKGCFAMVWTCTKNVQSIRHLRSSDVEQPANDSQKFQHLVKLQICFEVSLVYLTILEAAPTVTICDGALNRFYVLWRRRNYRRIIIKIAAVHRTLNER